MAQREITTDETDFLCPPPQDRGHGDMESGDTVGMMFDIRTTILRPTNVNFSNPEGVKFKKFSSCERSNTAQT